jgi:hypothetical protein
LSYITIQDASTRYSVVLGVIVIGCGVDTNLV